MTQMTQMAQTVSHMATAAPIGLHSSVNVLRVAGRLALGAGAGAGAGHGNRQPALSCAAEAEAAHDAPDDPADEAGEDPSSGRALLRLHGALLRRLRIEAGMSQAELAERLAYTQQEVSNWERGLHRIPVSLRGQVLALFADVRQTRHNNLAQLHALIERGRLQREMEQWPTLGEVSDWS